VRVARSHQREAILRTISLPDPLHAAAEHLAARGGFDSTEQYIADLVRRDIEQNPPEPSPPLREIVEAASGRTLTDAQWERTTRKIESLLMEGLDSGPATEMTAKEWESIRQEVQRRLPRSDAESKPGR
jgi:antitoxin ParD1/3/4